jgi:predicted dehydrogenase
MRVTNLTEVNVEKLRIGLIGCGGMGAALAKAAAGLERAEVVAVSDVFGEAAEKLSQELGAQAYGDDGRKILRRRDIAAVIVATPPYLHRNGVVRAARARKHIFSEKPMATNVSDCDAMLRAVEKAGVKLQIGQVLRYLPLQSMTIELVRSGKYGEPIAISVTRVGGSWGSYRTSWRYSHQQSGGVLMEVNAHELDLMRQICGDARTVCAHARRYFEQPMTSPDQVFVIMEFESGAMGHLHSSFASAIGETSCKVQCREGAIFYRSGPGLPGTLWHGAFREQPTAVLDKDIAVENPVAREVREWVDAVLDDKPVTIPGIDGRKAVELAEAAYHSARTGKPVKLPLKRATGTMAREWED